MDRALKNKALAAMRINPAIRITVAELLAYIETLEQDDDFCGVTEELEEYAEQDTETAPSDDGSSQGELDLGDSDSSG